MWDASRLRRQVSQSSVTAACRWRKAAGRSCYDEDEQSWRRSYECAEGPCQLDQGMMGRIKCWEAQALMTACHPVGHAEQSARKEVTKVVEILDTGSAHVMIDGLDPPCSLLYGDLGLPLRPSAVLISTALADNRCTSYAGEDTAISAKPTTALQYSFRLWRSYRNLRCPCQDL